MVVVRKLAIATVLSAASSVCCAQGGDPLLRPIEPEFAKRLLGDQAPVHVFGNSYSVGFDGVSVGLIRTSAGLILIDGAVPQTVRTVEANLKRLGFSIRQVRYILSTEPHYDHSGGIAALSRDSGATVLASVDAARALRRGETDADDAQGYIAGFPPIRKLRIVRDGERIRLGDTIVTAHLTGGHTPGSMSWSWRSCEGKRCAEIVFASSLNPGSEDPYRFTDHPRVVANFRRSFAKLRAMKCDVLLTAHPQHSGNAAAFKALAAKSRATANSFVDPAACRVYANRFEKVLDDKLMKEASGR